MEDFLFVCAAAFLISCGQHDEAPHAATASNVAASSAPDAAVSVAPTPSADAPSSTPFASAEIDAGPPPNDTVVLGTDDDDGLLRDFSVRLERTACLGTCPMYVVHVGPHGAVRFSSRLFVHDRFVDGCASKNIGNYGVVALQRVLTKYSYFTLQKTYTGGPTDAPSTDMSVTMAHKTKVVHHYVGAPVRPTDAKRLDALESEIDKISGAADFMSQAGSLTPCTYTGT